MGDPDDPEGGTLCVNGHAPLWLPQRQFLVILALGEHLLRLSGARVYVVIDTSSLFPSAERILSGIQGFLGRLDRRLGVFTEEQAEVEDIRDLILAIRKKLEAAGIGRHFIQNGAGRFGYMLNVEAHNITVICPKLDATSSRLKRSA